MIRFPRIPLLLVVLLATACSSDPAPTPPPTSPPAPTTSASHGRAPTPTPAAVTPSPTGSITPTASPPVAHEWTTAALPVANDFSTVGVIDIAHRDGVFLALGAGWQEDQAGVQVNVPLFWRSRDGQAWELLDADWSEGYVDALTTWQGRWLAAGYVGDERASAAFWTSADGRSWQRLPDQPVLQFFRGATEGRDIVAGGISHVRSDGDELIARGWLYCACANEIRDGAVEWRTTDGREWQRTDLPPGEDVAPPVETDERLLRIADGSSAIEASTDGGASWESVWTPAAAISDDAPAAQLFALGRAGDGLLAVGVVFEDNVGRPLALASRDGAAWFVSPGNAFAELEGAIVDFASGESAVVAVGRVGEPPTPFVWVTLND